MTTDTFTGRREGLRDVAQVLGAVVQKKLDAAPLAAWHRHHAKRVHFRRLCNALTQVATQRQERDERGPGWGAW